MQKQFFLCLLLAATVGAKAGDSVNVFRRTGIYVEMGGPGYIHLNGNLEHYFVNRKCAHLGVRAGYGSWGSWGGGGEEAIFTVTGQAGRKYHFAEVQAGSLLFTGPKEQIYPGDPTRISTPVYLHPFFSLGYVLRWKHLQLKANVNSKITINAGVGLIF